MIPSDLADEALDLVRHIAPEFKLHNLYLLDAADLQRLEPDTSCMAYVETSIVPPDIRDHLQAIGEWEGQGSAIVVCTDNIRRDCNNFRVAFLTVMLHEICHLLPLSIAVPVDVDPTPQERKQAAEVHHEFITKPVCNLVAADHGDRFARIACHVLFRALAIGFVAPAHQMFAGYTYGLSHPHDYYEALGGEPFRMSGELFSTIARTPPPRAFIDLWKKDLARLEQR